MKMLIFKVLCIILVIILLASLIIPIISNAVTDTEDNKILNSIENIQNNIDESKYPGYKEKLIALKKLHPNWTFTIYYTGLDWNTVIKDESIGLHSRSLVQDKKGEWLCSTCGTKVYDAGGWMCASTKAVAYLMDPRNYLTENYIFQFEKLSYDKNLYTIDGIEKVLNGTFMYHKNIREYYNNQKFDNITFAEAIMEASKTSGVSPYYLASRIRQEIGINGSNSIYGTYKGHEGYYNFYNIGANSGTDPIGNGLKYASNTTLGKYLLPWTDPVKAIKGGAIWIAANYISIGQDTLYFQKFDVVNNDTPYYTHQYMQNIFAAKNEGYTEYLAYNKLGILNNSYNFVIPLYENMGTTLSKEPSETIINTTTSKVSNQKVQVIVSNLYVRSKPTTSSSRIATLSKYATVTRLQTKVKYANGYYWDKIQLSNGKIGYVANKYVSTNIINVIKKKTTAYVNVRSSATTKSSIIRTLPTGTAVTVLKSKIKYANGYYWDKVELLNGKIGYMATKYLK